MSLALSLPLILGGCAAPSNISAGVNGMSQTSNHHYISVSVTLTNDGTSAARPACVVHDTIDGTSAPVLLDRPIGPHQIVQTSVMVRTPDDLVIMAQPLGHDPKDPYPYRIQC